MLGGLSISVKPAARRCAVLEWGWPLGGTVDMRCLAKASCARWNCGIHGQNRPIKQSHAIG